jgi:Flp pilus assembly secretin CpaC
LRVKSVVRTVIIGDPKIVDASMVDERTVAVTAKALGTTNMILLDGSHSQIMQTTVQVSSQMPSASSASLSPRLTYGFT